MDLRTRQLFRILIPFLDVALKLPSPVREVRGTDWITQPTCGFCPPSTLTRRSCPSFFTLTCSKYPHTSGWTVKIFSVSSIIPSIFDTPLPRCQKVPAILQRAIFVCFNMRAWYLFRWKNHRYSGLDLHIKKPENILRPWIVFYILWQIHRNIEWFSASTTDVKP